MPSQLQPCISAGWLQGLLGSANLPFIDALLLHHCPSLSEGGHLRRNVVSFGEIERGGLLLVVLGEIDRPMCRWVMPVGVRSGGKITGNGCVPDPPPSAPLADLTAYLSAHIPAW